MRSPCVLWNFAFNFCVESATGLQQVKSSATPRTPNTTCNYSQHNAAFIHHIHIHTNWSAHTPTKASIQRWLCWWWWPFQLSQFSTLHLSALCKFDTPEPNCAQTYKHLKTHIHTPATSLAYKCSRTANNCERKRV